MDIPIRHQSFTKGKFRNFYLLPFVYYENNKKLKLRWGWKTREIWDGKTYLTKMYNPKKITVVNILLLPYTILNNLYYFGRTGFTYEEIDYDEIYGE